MKLKVIPAAREDVYKDIVRVHEQYRLAGDKRVVPEGCVCKISTPDKRAYAIVRGCGDGSEKWIYIDERLRNTLGLTRGEEVEVRFEPAGFWGQFYWAWTASDPAYRVAARLGLLSVVLGLLGLVLGLLSLTGCS
jgi:hypothetical protein